MAKPTSSVKDRYNKKAYDTICLRVKKGEKEKIIKRVRDLDCPSVNNYINSLIKKDRGD
ncbi:MAG: antitoxin [Hungatella sp.]|jgi:hypothetical protein|nr:antitoxin [Hungatella sp.]